MDVGLNIYSFVSSFLSCFFSHVNESQIKQNWTVGSVKCEQKPFKSIKL